LFYNCYFEREKLAFSPTIVQNFGDTSQIFQNYVYVIPKLIARPGISLSDGRSGLCDYEEEGSAGWS